MRHAQLNREQKVPSIELHTEWETVELVDEEENVRNDERQFCLMDIDGESDQRSNGN